MIVSVIFCPCGAAYNNSSCVIPCQSEQSKAIGQMVVVSERQWILAVYHNSVHIATCMNECTMGQSWPYFNTQNHGKRGAERNPNATYVTSWLACLLQSRTLYSASGSTPSHGLTMIATIRRSSPATSSSPSLDMVAGYVVREYKWRWSFLLELYVLFF